MKLIGINLHCPLGTVLLLFCLSVSGQESKAPKLIIPFGHQLGIKNTLFSNDNKLIITADEKITIISDVRSGKPLYYLKGTNPAISYNDKYVATVLDSLVMIWSMQSGQLAFKTSVSSKAAQTAFNPINDLLLIKSLASDGSNAHEELYYNIQVWDYINSKLLKDFYTSKQVDDPLSTKCYPCGGNVCAIYGAWFNYAGDSLRLIFKNCIKTFSINDFSHASRVCLKAPGTNSVPGEIKILNNHFIELADDSRAYCFNENSVLVGSWPIKSETGFFMGNGADVISPALNFQASYSASKIILRDLKNHSERFFEITSLKKLSFNDAGTYMLAEYLNEEPKLISTTTGKEVTGLVENDFKGLPVYVYETRTSVDAQGVAAVFDSIEVKIPVANAKDSLMKPYIDIMNEQAKDFARGIKQSIESSFTNSGVIVNLYNNRVISKIQSLIKYSGDVRLSPNRKVMLLNSGKVISLYSIPYAKLIINLTGNASESVFSADSKWLFQYYMNGKANIVNLVTGQVKVVKLKLKDNINYLVTWSSNCKNVFLSSGKGSVISIDVVNGKEISNTGSLNYFYSQSGDKIGIVDQASRKARIIRAGDSVQLYELDLNAHKAKNNRQYAFNWRICFSSRSNAVAFWHERQIIYAYDIINSPDSVINEGGEEGGTLTNVTLSPNGLFVNLQFNYGNAIIYNVKDSNSSFPAVLEMDEGGAQINILDIGGSIREGMSGKNRTVSADIAQFSETGDSVMVCKGDSVVIYLSATGEKLKSFHIDGEIKYFDFKGNVLVAYYYGQLKYYKLAGNKEWFSMIPFNTGETVFLLPNGVYFGSKSVTRHLGYMYEGKSLSYKQFDYGNNRPDIVLQALGNTNKNHLGLYNAIVALRRKREGVKDTIAVDLDKAPMVTIENDREINGEVKSKELVLKLKINVKDSYADRLAVFINGNPVNGSKGIPLVSKSSTIDTTVKLILTEGANAIEVSVFNTANMESYRQPLYVQYSPDKPVVRNIYFAGIGVAKYSNRSKNLSWPQKDVKDVLDSLRKHYKKPPIVDTFFNDNVTVDKLKNLNKKFKGSHPDDIVILYYSGHGKLDPQKAEAYLGTYNMDFSNPSVNGISIKDFSELVDDIPSRNKVIFLDACNSGELNKAAWQQTAGFTPGAGTGGNMATGNAGIVSSDADTTVDPGESNPFDLMLELFTDLYQGNGTNIVVAARGLEAAKECNSIKHGVFTYTVLSGMAGLTADEDSNAILTIGELQNYVIRNTTIFSDICEPNKIQRASVRKENEFNDWAILASDSMLHYSRSKVKEVTPKITSKPDWGSIPEKKAPAPTVSTNPELPPASEKVEEPETTTTVTKSEQPEKLTLRERWKKLKEDAKAIKDDVKDIVGKKKGADFLREYQKTEHPNAKLLFQNSSSAVYYELINRQLVFNVSCSGCSPSIWVDVNGNKIPEACNDLVYQMVPNTDSVTAQYVINPDQSSSCNGNIQSAAAYLAVEKGYLFLIPVNEIKKGNTKKVTVNVSLDNNANKEIKNYSREAVKKLFDEAIEIVVAQ